MSQLWQCKNEIDNVKNCIIFELLVFFGVHLIKFHDNKVCHANGVSREECVHIVCERVCVCI